MESIQSEYKLLSNHNVLLEFSIKDATEIGKEKKITGRNESFKILSWGSNNLLPQNREEVIMDNNIIGELISTKRSIILGEGITGYKEVYKDGTRVKEEIPLPPKIADWIQEADFDNKYLVEAANQLLMHANIPVSMMPAKDGKSIASMMTYKCRDVRAEKRDFGKPISKWYFGDWVDKKFRDYQPISTAPTNKTEWFYVVGDKLFFDGTYCHPAYWGGKEWIDLSNVIPKFHKANIKNGYVIRFHIEIPKNAFLDSLRYQQAEGTGDESLMTECLNKAEAEKEEFIDRMNKFLSGAENAGRAIYTFFEHDPMGKKLDGVKINPVTAELNDEALLKLFEKSNQANISGQGLHPTIANIETQGKLSSGSEMRNSIEMYVKIKAPIFRNILLNPFLKVAKINGWTNEFPELKFGWSNISLTTLDENPQGSQPIVTK